MNDDELKKLWQEQPLREPVPSAEHLVSAMQNKMTGFRSILVQRDFGEFFACGFVIIIFGIFYFTYCRTPISRLGDLFVIASSLFVAWKLVHARRMTPPAPAGATIVDSLRAELKAVQTQARLLRAVLWWYLLPLTIGALVMTWGNLPLGDPAGVRVMAGADIVVTLVFIATNIWVYRLNQRAVAKQLLPLEAQLEALLRSAETGEPVDQTQVAGLRPIALSMAAASQVKIAEFKVAFWQLALWSLVGFIGIWFFLAFDSSDWRTEDARHVTAPPAIHFDATNRYSIVARQVIDLFNAGDYAGVHKLYNADMSKAFPLKKTSEFYNEVATAFGKIANIEGPTGKGYEGWTAFRLYCDNGELTMSLALDDDDQISGIYFQPVLEKLTTWEIVCRLFSWNHLLWLVLCVAIGLLQAWILHKRTGRTVGISTLGIHLNQGLDLILWDEIKEVRPIRILNIRSLRLIKASGETQLIPWTSLERHADLKAAVENCAPADHPIRNYLSLLRRR